VEKYVEDLVKNLFRGVNPTIFQQFYPHVLSDRMYYDPGSQSVRALYHPPCFLLFHADKKILHNKLYWTCKTRVLQVICTKG